MKRTTEIRKKKPKKPDLSGVIFRTTTPKKPNLSGVIFRTTTPKNSKKGIVIMNENPLGGHIPNPPEDCVKKKFFKEYKGTVWLDLSICNGCEKKPVCIDRKTYLIKLKKERNDRLLIPKNKEKVNPKKEKTNDR